MKSLSISEVRNSLPQILKKISKSHETITILRYGKPIASIVPLENTKSEQEKYPLRRFPINISKDFDEPIPELWDVLEK